MLLVFPPLCRKIGVKAVLRYTSIAWAITLAWPPICNILLRKDYVEAFWISSTLIVIQWTGSSMGFGRLAPITPCSGAHAPITSRRTIGSQQHLPFPRSIGLTQCDGAISHFLRALFRTRYFYHHLRHRNQAANSRWTSRVVDYGRDSCWTGIYSYISALCGRWKQDQGHKCRWS